MKKLFIAMSVLLLLCGCEKSAEIPSEISETSQTAEVTEKVTETEVTTAAEKVTAAKTESTTVATTVPTESTTVATTIVTEPELPEAILPAEAVQIDIGSLYEGKKYDFSCTILDEENIFILFTFKDGDKASADGRIFSISDGTEKAHIEIPESDAEKFSVRDALWCSEYYDDEENIWFSVFAYTYENNGYEERYIKKTETLVYTDYIYESRESGGGNISFDTWLERAAGEHIIQTTEYGNIFDWGNDYDLLLNGVYDGIGSKRNVYYYHCFPIDENRFVYSMGGDEGCWGFGVYDYTAGTASDVPETFDFHPIGIHNGKIYSYYADRGDTDNIIYGTDINTLETTPLFEVDSFYYVYDYKMTPNGELFMNTVYNEKDHIFTVILSSTDTLEVIKKYTFENIFRSPCCTNLVGSAGAFTVSSDEKFLYIIDFDK